MRVFLTGATGFIGSRIVPELIGAGHQVLGLTRTDAGARQLELVGAQAHFGTLDDPDSVARGASGADAVLHTAFDHDDFTRFLDNCDKDRRVIEAIGAALAGSDRPFIITSGVGMGSRDPARSRSKTCSTAKIRIRAACRSWPARPSPSAASLSRWSACRRFTTPASRA